MPTMLISGNNKVKYTYDHMGKINEVDLNDIDNYVTVIYDKDDGNDVTVATMNNDETITTITTVRDPLGNLVSSSVGNNTVSYKYTNDNLIEFVTDSVEGWDKVVTKYEYNNDRAVSKISTHSDVGVSASD